MAETRAGGAPPVQAVARAFALLEALGAQEEAGLSELARRVGLHPSTAHRLLASLIECGYAAQSAVSGRYRMTLKILELAAGTESLDARLRSLARPHLEAIRAAIDETSNLVALDGSAAVYLEQVESRRAVRLFAEPGRRVPAHASGAGKAMLAFQDPASLERFLATAPWERLTAQTIVRGEDMRAELERIRRRGYAMDNEEYEEGVSCVGAAVLDERGSPCGALSVSAPSPRLHRCGLAELGRLLASHAADLSQALGLGGAAPSPPPRRRSR